jgi:hypothetical protein
MSIVAIQMRAGKGCPMSALGQKQTCAAQKGMSVLPPIATLIASSESPVDNPCRRWGLRIFDKDDCADAGHNDPPLSQLVYKRPTT